MVEKNIKPIDLYYAPTPNGWKITILLEEAGIPYRIIPVNLSAGDQFKPSFLKISPNNRMPVIVDHNTEDGEPISVFESGAIMAYLGDRYASAERFFPTDIRKRTSVLQWLFWMNANLGPVAGQVSHFSYYAPKIASDMDHSYSLNRYRMEYDRLISVMERQLTTTGAYLAGDFYSAADMATWPWVKPWKRWMGNDFEKYPRVRRWYNELKQRPALRRGFGVMKSVATNLQQQREGKSPMRGPALDMFQQDGSKIKDLERSKL